MNIRFLHNLQLALAGLDLLSLNVIFFTAEYLFGKQYLIGTYIAYSGFGFFLSTAWLLITLLTNIYHEKYIFSFELFSKRTLYGFITFLLLLVFYLFFFHQFNISRAFVIIILCSFAVSLAVNRFLYLIIYQYFKKKDYISNKVVIIGYNSLSKKLVDYLENDGINKRVVGFCEEYENIDELSHYPILSDVNNVFNICREYGVTEIYSTITPEQNSNIYYLMNEADQQCIRFKIIPDISLFVNRFAQIDYLNEIPLISLRHEPLEYLESRIRKRMLDLAFSLFIITFILSWLCPLIALLIKLDSRGPVFFLQNRAGRDNKIFKVYKFRSMKFKESDEFKQASKEDTRITRLGRFLRKTSLDELPQFFNVFAGHMSVCGPRPHPINLNDSFKEVIDKYMVRQFLKPGITGWAQVNGYRGETQTTAQMEKRVEYDLWYMENWSLWLDVKIIFLTFYNILKGEENAY